MDTAIITSLLIGIIMLLSLVWQGSIMMSDGEVHKDKRLGPIIFFHPLRLSLPFYVCLLFVLGTFIFTIIKLFVDLNLFGLKDIFYFLSVLALSIIQMVKMYLSAIYIGFTISTSLYFFMEKDEVLYLPLIGPLLDTIFGSFSGNIHYIYIIVTVTAALVMTINDTISD